MLRTHLTTELGLRYPLIGAPMANLAGGELARAITQAGGLGMIGVGSRDSAEFVAREASAARHGNPGIRFGIGVMAWDAVRRPQLLDAVIAARPFLASVSFGTVGPHVARLHDAGILVTTQVHDSAETVAATEAGVDLIVVQGGEAGGHTGAVATMPLLQIVLQATTLPVVAAGGHRHGIGDGGPSGGGRGRCVGRHSVHREPGMRAPAGGHIRDSGRPRDRHHPHPRVRPGSGHPLAGTVPRAGAPQRIHGPLARARGSDGRGPLSSAPVPRRLRARRLPPSSHLCGQAVGLVQAARPAGEVVREIAEGAEVLLRARCAHLLH